MAGEFIHHRHEDRHARAQRPELEVFAAKTLPALKRHLESAQALK